ncbi:hypothetical protein [Alkaliphilus oremlandii]|uniref:hypothetical protein n=1 Tax=Alkaliphilus oremlandii TaxID=461876 RepID=UPI0000D82D44|nr:hypothetical protein [Alkaliphilus oremlandii]
MSEYVESAGLCGENLVGNVTNNRGCGGGNSGIGNLFGNQSSLLFFFLLLVIIFFNCGIFRELGDSLLFFFLLLIVLFCKDSFCRF